MRLAYASLALLLATTPVVAQGLKTYLPAASASKASSYLAAIDAANSGIRSRRAAARAEQLEAETAALAAFALLYAADSGDEWADPEGGLTSAGAAAAFAEARARALRVASALSSGGASTKESGTAELEKKRDESTAKMRAVLKDASLGQKAAAGIEKLLSDRIKSLGKLFPEIVEVQALLRKAGAAGCRLLAESMAGGSAELVAAAFVESADEILAAAPAASRAMESLAASYGAYSAWMSGFALAACPGELASSMTTGPEPLSRGIAAFASLEPARASALVAALESGDGREAAAAAAARRLAAVWESLGAARRRELAAACAVQGSTMMAFASALAPSVAPRDQAVALSPDSILLSLNSLAAMIAGEGSDGSRSGPELALLLLERPELAAAAAFEPRYASLYEQCDGRLEAIYRRAADDAAASIEAMPAVLKAAARSLGSAAQSLVVEAIDLGSGERSSGRRIAFVAIAKDSQGRITKLPVRAEMAADAYARSFAKAAGLGGVAAKSGTSSGGGAQKLLERYGQSLVTAYDPSRAGLRLAIASYPKGAGIDFLSAIYMEREMLEGWRP